MPADVYGLVNNAIWWNPEETDVSQSSVDFIEIRCSGLVKEENQTLQGALVLIPSTCPISPEGPVGNSTGFATASLDTRGVRYGADGTIVVNATYKLPLSNPSGGGGPTFSQQSDSDRFDLRVETEDAPLLTHPVAIRFPLVEKNKLKNLMEGDVVPNPDYNGTTDTVEFIYAVDMKTKSKDAECVFDDTDVTFGGVTASPIDYARCLLAGVDTYKRSSVRFQWSCTRTEGPDDAELNTVGDIVTSSVLPSVADDRDWFYAGVTSSHEAEGAYNITRDFTLSERGGALQEIYKGGSGSINDTAGP